MIDLAVEAARKAGEVHKKHFNRLESIESKGKFELVTKADTESEKVIVDALKDSGYNVLGEEFGFTDNKSDYCWVIDPLDGTTNFAHNIPWFCVSIGLLRGNEPVGAVIFDSIHNELLTAEKGKGASMNDRKLEIRSSSPESAVVGTDWGYEKRSELMPYVEKVIEKVKYLRIMGSAAKGLADVAMNRSQSYFHRAIKPWDMAAGCLIIREAGGVVTALDGSEWDMKCGTILAAGKQLHKQMLEVFS